MKLGKENTRLKRLVADLSLETQVLKDIASGNLSAPNCGGKTVERAQKKYRLSRHMKPIPDFIVAQIS
jgi:hypothetical protein